MREGYGVVVRMTQAEIDAGDANTLVGVRIEVIGATGQPTGKIYESGPAGSTPVENSSTIKNNFAATAAPTVSNDNTQGYAVGSRWIDTTNDESYVCTDAATGAAVWSKTTVGTVAEVAGLQTALDLRAPLASPTFTGIVGGITKTMVGLGSVDNTTDAGKPLSNAAKSLLRNRDTVSEGLTGRLIHLRSEGLAVGALAAWNDESGQGSNVAQATTANQPDVTAAAIGTKQAVRCNGTTDFLQRSSVNIGTDWTIVAIVRTGASVGGQIVSDSYPSAVSYTLGINTGVIAGLTNNAIFVGTFSGSWVGTAASVAATANTTYIITATRTQGGNLVLRVNGQQVGSVASGTNPTFESAGTLYVGRRWDTSASPYWNGDIGEVKLFNRVLSADEISLVEGMLAHKYEAQSLLPAAHAYAVESPSALNIPVSGIAPGAEVNVQPDWNQATTTADDFINNKPTLGTASPLNVPATGNASATEVVKGGDTRLSDSRTPTAHKASHEGGADAITPAGIGAQATLVSGTNVKTVGGTTVLGPGDIPFPVFATSLRLMTPTDIIEDTDRAVFLLADDLALGAISAWANPGTGGDFAQATGTAQPSVVAVTALGGRRAALFDGTSDFMDVANISLGTRYGLFAVFIPAALGNQFILSEVYSPGTVEYFFGLQTGKFAVGHFNGAWRLLEAASPTPVIGTPYILAAGYDGANLSVKVDGGTAVTLAQTSDPIFTDAANTRLGRRWDGTTDFFNGHIACVVVKRNAFFTATELAQLEGWASWYYSFVTKLPVGHTYKNAPPLITA